MGMNNASVGVWQTLTLSREVRQRSTNKQKFRQFVKPEEAIGPHMGNQFSYSKMGKVAATGREVGEYDDIPTTTFPIRSNTLTAAEHSNSIEYTSRAMLFSELSLADAIILALQDDYDEYMDKLAAAQFRQADLVYTPTGSTSSMTHTLTTNGVAGAVATRPIAAYDIKNISDIMQDYNIPKVAGSNDYVCITGTKGHRNVKDDGEWIDASKYGQPGNLLDGEVGRYQQIRFLHENNALTQSIAGGNSEMIFFGDDAVVEIELYPMEMQAAIADSYGRFRAVRWTTFVGFDKVWDFGTDDGETRILKVASL